MDTKGRKRRKLIGLALIEENTIAYFVIIFRHILLLMIIKNILQETYSIVHLKCTPFLFNTMVINRV